MARDHEDTVPLDPGPDPDPAGPAPQLSLAAAVAGLGPLPTTMLRPLGAGLARELAAVHASGHVHGELNPVSVVLAADGPRIARRATSATTVVTEAGAGTGDEVAGSGFHSPEQVSHGAVGPASDVFSLACVLTFAATGHGPFGDGPAVAVGYRLMNGAPELGDVPPPLADLLAACLAKDPGERPTSDEVVRRLTAEDPATGFWPSAQITELAGRPATPIALSGAGAFGGPGDPTAGAPSGGRPLGRRALITGAIAAAIAIPVGVGIAFAGGGKNDAKAGKGGGGATGGKGGATPAGRTVTFTPAATLVAETIVNSDCVLAFSPQPGTLMTAAGAENKSASTDATEMILQWDIPSQKIVGAIHLTDTVGVNRIRYSRDGKYVAAACLTLGGDLGIAVGGTVLVFDSSTLKTVAKLARESEDPASMFAMQDVAFSPDGSLIAGAQNGKGCIGKVPVWDVASQSLRQLLVVGAGKGSEVSAVFSVAFSPDGSKLAAGWGKDLTAGVTIWDTASFTQLAEWSMPGDAFGVGSLAFSPDGRQLAGSFGSVAIWDVASHAVVAALTPAETPDSTGPDYQGVAFSPDGSLLVATTGTQQWGQVDVWDAKTRQHLVAEKTGSGTSHPGFSPDGRQLGVASANSKAQPIVQIWNLA